MFLHISKCPNDLFVFYNFKKYHNIQIQYKDIDTTNQYAINGILDVGKVSCAIFDKIQDNYNVLSCGSAISTYAGPLIVCKKPIVDYLSIKSKEYKIGIPSFDSSAYTLFKIWVKGYINIDDLNIKYIQVDYKDTINYLESGDLDIAIVIHEARYLCLNDKFYFEDLGKWWVDAFNLPVPLGMIIAHKMYDKQYIENLIIESLQYSNKHYDDIIKYISSIHKDMSIDNIKDYINTYVNDYTYKITNKAYEAIYKLNTL